MQLQQQLRQFVVDNFLYGRANGLGDDTSFLDAGIIDSTGVLELISHLEQVYNVQMEDHELVPDNLDSINKLAAFLQRKIQQRDMGATYSAS
jgi:acyl carrier protein